MYTNNLLISLSSLVVILVAWISYFKLILQIKVSVKSTGTIILQCIGIGLGVLSITLNIVGNKSFSFLVFLPAIFSVALGFIFLLFYSQRKTPIGNLKVIEGDKLIPFSAATSDGKEFSSDELAGKRILLKFFRGAW